MIFYDYNNFGISGDDTDSGVIALIDMDNREVVFSTTGLAISVYNDYSVEQVLDAYYPYLGNDEFYKAAIAGLKRSSEIIRTERSRAVQEFRSDDAGNYLPPLSRPTGFRLNDTVLLTGLAGGGGGALVVVLILLGLHNKSLPSAPSARTHFQSERLRSLHKADIFVSTHTSRFKLPEASSSSGGGDTHTHFF